MPKQNKIRYKYHFEFFDASGKYYSRTRRFNHKITDEEEIKLTQYYSYLLSLQHNTCIYSSSTSYLGKEPFNEKYITNRKH